MATLRYPSVAPGYPTDAQPVNPGGFAANQPYGRDEGVLRAGPPAPAGVVPPVVPPPAMPAPAGPSATQNTPGFWNFLNSIFGGGAGGASGMTAMLNRPQGTGNMAGRL